MKKPTQESLGDDRDKQINEILDRGVENIYPNRKFLKEKLESGKKLKLYLGIDPTGDALHMGHAIPIKKMRKFQDLGHEIIILIGGFTGQIGDPTDKGATRVRLTKKQVEKNSEKYKEMISKLLDTKKTKFVNNAKWFEKMTLEKVIDLASNFTVQQMLERDMFDRRIKAQKPVHLHEFLYPLMQGYDTVELGVDGEVGGNDQTFNMLAGRTLMKALKGKEKFVLTTKLLVDSTGKKMGKTEGNMIKMTDSPDEMFGKVMSWTDDMISLGFELITDISMKEIEFFEKAMKKGENPRDIKFKLAEEVVNTFYGRDVSYEAGKRFNKQFKEKKIPTDIPEIKIKESMKGIIDLVFELEMASSKSEARRLIQQGGVRIDEEKITDTDAVLGIHDGMLVQVGKRRFTKIKHR